MTQWQTLEKSECDVCKDDKVKEVLVLTGNAQVKRACWTHLKTILRYENMLNGKERVPA